MLRFWRCCGRGWWRCRSSRTAAPGGAAAVPNVRFQLFPFSSYVSVFSFSSLPSLLSVCFSFLCFFFYVFLSSRFLSSFGSYSLSPLFFFVFSVSSVSSPLRSSSPALLGPIYRAKGVALYCSHGEQPAGRPLARLPKSGPPPPGFLVGARWVVGHCVRSVGSRRESGRQKFKLKQTFFLLPRCVIGGRR